MLGGSQCVKQVRLLRVYYMLDLPLSLEMPPDDRCSRFFVDLLPDPLYSLLLFLRFLSILRRSFEALRTQTFIHVSFGSIAAAKHFV